MPADPASSIEPGGPRPDGARERARPYGAPGQRNESDLERLDRNLVELLQEVRVVQTGVQVLFAFLLTVPFSSRFDEITGFQRGVYFAALVASTAAAVLLIAPTSVHRILFRLGQKEYMVEVSNRLAIGGLASTAVAMIAVVLLISDLLFSLGWAVLATVLVAIGFAWFWYGLALLRRAER
jgi:hypothetical protein